MRWCLPIVFVWTLHEGVRVFDGQTDITDSYYSETQDDHQGDQFRALDRFLDEQEKAMREFDDALDKPKEDP